MDNSPDENTATPISQSWNRLIDNPDDMKEYISEALMIRPSEKKRRTVLGQPQKAVQMSSIKGSIVNNADSNKKGLTYLAMRSIHYWKTIYERAIQDPEKIEQYKEKYVSKHFYESVLDDCHLEMEEMQDQLNNGETVSKAEYDEVRIELQDMKKKIENMEIEHTESLKRTDDFHRKKESITEDRNTKVIDFYKDELAKLAKQH